MIALLATALFTGTAALALATIGAMLASHGSQALDALTGMRRP